MTNIIVDIAIHLLFNKNLQNVPKKVQEILGKASMAKVALNYPNRGEKIGILSTFQFLSQSDFLFKKFIYVHTCQE